MEINRRSAAALAVAAASTLLLAPAARATAGLAKLVAVYKTPKDPAAFDKYYREVHIPLAKRMKGLKKWTIGK